MRQVDRDVLPLRVAVEHPFERELAADAAFFVATIGVTRTLAETLVDLDPAGLYRVRSAKCAANVVRPDVGGEPAMRIASASSVQGMATSTGPKISSRARRQSFATFAKMVGIA